MSTLLNASVIRETEKAYLVDTTFDTAMGLKARDIWFPKSRTNWDGKNFECEDWLIEAKNSELPAGSYGIVLL